MYYRAHWRRTFNSINALQAFYRMPKLFTRRNILFCIIFGSDLDPNGLPCKERERETVYAPPFGKIKVTNALADRQGELFFLN